MEDIDSILLRQKEEINQLKKELEYKKYGTNETRYNRKGYKTNSTREIH